MSGHLNAAGLYKQYGETVVLQDASFQVESGEFVSIVGPSGCGKSTVLEIVGGLREADRGSVTIDGEVVTGPRDSTGIIFQEASTLPWRTMIENVCLALEVRGVPKQERVAAAHKAIETVGLKGFERHFPSQLSGGMRQRVALARVLTTSPALILADEPFGALDEQTRLMVALELLDVVARTSASVLFITHSIQEAVLLSDRVLVMSARPGRILDEVVIDLPRPRGADLIGSRQLDRFTERIWTPLKSQAQLAMSLQGMR